jgi:hypothetical protein
LLGLGDLGFLFFDLIEFHQQIWNLEDVFLEQASPAWLVERCRRVEHWIVDYVANPFGLSMYTGDGCAGEVALHGKTSQGNDQPGAYQLDLLVEIGPTGVDLLGLRIPVSWWSALDHIGYVYVLSFEADLFQELVQVVARRANEGSALAIFVKAGALTDEHDVGILRAFAGHGMGPSLAQDAPLATLNFFAEISKFGQRMAPFLFLTELDKF